MASRNFPDPPDRMPSNLRPNEQQSAFAPTEEQRKEQDFWNGQHTRASQENRFAGKAEVNEARQAGKLIQTASEVQGRGPVWIYENWLPSGELTLLAGAPTHGKTALTCYLAAAVTPGNRCNFNVQLRPTQHGSVIIINGEDDIETTLRPRLDAVGANPRHIHFLTVNQPTRDGAVFNFSWPDCLSKLTAISRFLKERLRLIIIDPIYMAVDGDHKNASKARIAYQNLTTLARQLDCAVLGVAHTVKTTRGKSALERVDSPAALLQVPRQVLMLSKRVGMPTGGGGTHVLVKAKVSNGSPMGGLAYRLVTNTGMVSDGRQNTIIFEAIEALDGTADDILKESEVSSPEERASKTAQAMELLVQELRDGPRLGNDLIAIAESRGISKATLILARSIAGVQTKKRTGDGRSVWFLADQAEPENC